MIARATQPPAEVPREIPLQPGAGLRTGRNPLGTWVEGLGNGSDFRHPFLVTAGSADARISRGLILAETGIEPTIGDVPIGGDKQRRVPVLRLDASLVNDRKESWVCVEVTPDAEGKVADAKGGLVDGAKVEVVQRAAPFVTQGDTGRAPLAMLLYGRKVPQVFQIAMFHFRYETTLPVNGRRRHWFL